MGYNIKVQVINRTRYELLSRYIREMSIARFLDVNIMEITMACSDSKLGTRDALYDAIKEKYTDDDLLVGWIDDSSEDDASDILEWVEQDLLSRN